MSRLTKIVLSDEQHAALETGYKQGKTHSFRQHCQMILLKAQKNGLPPFYVPVSALVSAAFFALSAAQWAANSEGVWYSRLECRRSSL